MSQQKNLYAKSISLKDIKEFLDSEGLKIEMIKFAVEAYKTSWHRMSGVSMEFGHDIIRFGPSEGAVKLVAPSMRKLDLMDHNSAAIYAIMHDWVQSKLRTKGLVYLCDGVLVRIGPLRDPIIIAPKEVRSESKPTGLKIPE